MYVENKLFLGRLSAGLFLILAVTLVILAVQTLQGGLLDEATHRLMISMNTSLP